MLPRWLPSRDNSARDQAYIGGTIVSRDAFEFLDNLRSPPFDNGRWIFRGQSDERWLLQPLIERVALWCRETAYEQGTLDTAGLARFAIRTFRRHAHNYLTALPLDKDDEEWLAVMRHYGAPTKLLDWTKSPYVAAFFAAEGGRQNNSVVWAVDRVAVQNEARRMLGVSQAPSISIPGHLLGLCYDPPMNVKPVVVPIWPFRLNERLTIQQGVFLCYARTRLLGHSRPAWKNVLRSGSENGHLDEKWVRKFILPHHERLRVLRGTRTDERQSCDSISRD